MMWTETVIKDGLLGFVTGDALGVPVEYTERQELEKHPVRTMKGYGTYRQPPGTWSDETSLLLATLDSISQMGQIHLDDLMTRYLSWYDEKAYLAYGEVFDLPHITRNALENYRHGTAAYYSGGRSDFHNSNSAISRMLPIAFYLESDRFRQIYADDMKAQSPDHLAIQLIHQASCLTNGHYVALVCSSIYTYMARWLIRWRLDGAKPGSFRSADLIGHFERLISGLKEFYRTANPSLMAAPFSGDTAPSQEEKDGFEAAWSLLGRLEDLAQLIRTPVSEIYSDGYCLHAIEVVLYCLLKTDSYEDAVLMAVNLGEDTDTNGALVGGLAGLLYGREQIPASWKEGLARLRELEQHADIATISLFRPELRSAFMLIPWLEAAGPRGIPASLPREQFYPLGGQGEIYLDKEGLESSLRHLINHCTLQLSDDEIDEVARRVEYLRLWLARHTGRPGAVQETPVHLEIYDPERTDRRSGSRDWVLAELIFLIEDGKLQQLLGIQTTADPQVSLEVRMTYGRRLLENIYKIRRLYARGKWFNGRTVPIDPSLLKQVLQA